MPRRNPAQRLQDRATIAELTLKGWHQNRIAQYLEVDPAIINRELKSIKAEWKAESLEDTDVYIKSELRRIAMLEAEYWGAWQRSQEDKQVTVQERLSSLLGAESEQGGNSNGRSMSSRRPIQLCFQNADCPLIPIASSGSTSHQVAAMPRLGSEVPQQVEVLTC